MVMVNGIRASEPSGLNKECGLKFHVGSWVRQHMKEAGGHISQNIVNITLKILTIVQKPRMNCYCIVILGTILLCANKWIMLNRIINVK